MGIVLHADDDAYSALHSDITAMLRADDSVTDSSHWLDRLKSADGDIESTLQTIVNNAVTNSKSRHPQTIDAYARRFGQLADTPSLPSPPAIVQTQTETETETQTHGVADSECSSDDETPQLLSAWSERIVHDIVSDEKKTQKLIAAHIQQTLPFAIAKENEENTALNGVVRKPRVLFDEMLTTHNNSSSKVCVVQRRALRRGYHQWTVEVLQSDIEAQEMGVVSRIDVKGAEIDDEGVLATDAFGARVVFGNELCSSSIYVGAKDEAGNATAYGDLSKLYRRGWCTRDRIKICLDLDDWTIQFFLNGKAVKGMEEVSLVPHRVYHPVIVFGGQCRYKLHHY